MKSHSPREIQPAEWLDLGAIAGTAVRTAVHTLVVAESARLADRFYEAMFADPRAAHFLDHATVNRRLRGSMQRWLIQLFDPAAVPEALLATQRAVGEVHARIGVPMALVNRGARVLKRDITDGLAAGTLPRQALIEATLLVHELFAAALDEMGSAYASSTERLSRAEEAYRLFFLSQDMRAERERRRSELLEWAQQLLERYYWDERPGELAGRDHSHFELWLHHKAAMLFEGAPEIVLITDEMARIEQDLLPQLRQVRASHADARAVAAEINRGTHRIKDLLGAMFDHHLAVEDGRDSVTTLLNRRYFPAIARREIDIATRGGHPFALLMADLDHFAELSRHGGQESGNPLLAQAAQLLQEHVRAGDFVFRIGDDDFVILLVEADGPQALQVAEGLRRRFESSALRVGPGTPLTMTVSIGIAAFDGHPDYQRLLDRADEALRQAKQEGRNRCVLAA